MKKLPLSYWILLISGLFALLCIPLILIAEATGWFPDELIHLPQWIAIFVCFVSGIILHLKKGINLGRFHQVISKLGLVLSGMFLIAFAILILILIGPDVVNSIKYRKFDKQVWIQNEESVARIYMAENLIENKKLLGLTKNKVIELLGEPFYRDPIDGSTFPLGAYGSDIHYLLGPSRGFGIDSEWLMMTFGEHGKVDRCWLYED